MNKLAKTTLLLMIVTLLSKILGFGRELVLGAIYGASIYSDVYITAYNIPNIIFSIVGTALATTFIPLYYENNNIGGDKKSLNFTNNIFNIVLVIGIILSLIVFLFAEQVVKLFAVGFTGETLELAIKFTKITIFGGIFIGLSNIMSSILQIKENFVIPGVIAIPFNIIIIISMILGYTVDIILLPIGTMIAIASQFLFQFPFAYNKGYRYKFIFNLKDEYIKKMMCLVAPILIGVAVNQVNAMIDRTLASTLVEGSISALNYANRLNGFVLGMFIMSIGTVIYPKLSKLSNDKNKESFDNTVSKSINAVILLVVPISVGAIVLSTPIVKLLFQRGAFDEKATTMTAIALVFYSIGMLGFGLRDILNKVFYSIQDTRTPMINGALAMGMNIVFNIVLVKFLGHAGLALATSISALICILLLFNSLKKKIGYFGQDKIIKTTIKSLVAATVMGVVTHFTYNILANILDTGFIKEALVLFGSVIIGALVYGILVILLKVEEVSVVTNMIKKKILSKNKNIDLEIKSA